MLTIAAIHDHVVTMLYTGLSKQLTYHNTHHTLDVALQCGAIAKEEGITDKQVLMELQIAALYHDTGFLFTYQHHEERGCIIAREQLPGFGVSTTEIENICQLIMATRVPQTPTNHLQKIICDADLDYLGRDDFFETGNNLHHELIEYKLITDDHDWEERQLNFLQGHQYFTSTSRKKREPAKKEFIKKLILLKNTEPK